MSDILKEADAIAGQDRSRDYGHPHPNHLNIADLWNAFLKQRLKTLLTPGDVATMMILLKVARLKNTYTRDSVIDIAGYAKCLDMIHECEAANRNGMNGPVYNDVPIPNAAASNDVLDALELMRRKQKHLSECALSEYGKQELKALTVIIGLFDEPSTVSDKSQAS